MKKLNIVCIDDQPEVLSALVNDLDALGEECVNVTECDTTHDAWDFLEEMYDDGERVALLLCDHILPTEHGVDFLCRVHEDVRFSGVRKVLVTGQASHGDTIRAINEAGLNAYIAKPWERSQLLKTVKAQLTHYLLAQGEDVEPYRSLVDPKMLTTSVPKR